MKTLKWRKRVVFYQNMQIPWVPPLRHDFYRSLKVIKVITGPLWTGSYPLNSMTMRSLQGNQCVCVCVYTRGEEGGVVFWGNVAPTLISNSAEEGGSNLWSNQSAEGSYWIGIGFELVFERIPVSFYFESSLEKDKQNPFFWIGLDWGLSYHTVGRRRLGGYPEK
jgi:hypothetical protein